MEIYWELALTSAALGFVCGSIRFLGTIRRRAALRAFVRGLVSGLVHGICTVMVGWGIPHIRKHSKFYFCGTFALLGGAIIYHAIYNLLVQSQFQVGDGIGGGQCFRR